MSEGTAVDDKPMTVSIARIISGLADMALMLHGYTITGNAEGDPSFVVCGKCGHDPIFECDELTALEFLNEVLEHDERLHGDTA